MIDVTIVGLGVRNVDHVTREAERALRGANEILVVDTGPATVPFLAKLGPRVTPLYAASYREGGDRLNAYHHMAAATIEAALDHAPVVFAIHGHPVVSTYVPFLIVDLCRALGLGCEVLAGVSAMDALFAERMLDPCALGLQLYDATDLLLRARPLQPDVPALLWGVGAVETRLQSWHPSRPERFERLLRHLSRFYPADHQVAALFASPHPLVPAMERVFPLGELPAHADALHHGTTLYLPPVAERPIADQALLAALDDPAHLARITRGAS